MERVEKCCYIDREGTGMPCDSDAEYMVMSPEEAKLDQATYSCGAHFGHMRAKGDMAFDLKTGAEMPNKLPFASTRSHDGRYPI